MTESNFSIEGMDNLKRMFAEFPENGFRKPVIAAFRKAAAPFRKALISAIPPELKGIARAVKAKAGRDRENPSFIVGIFSNAGVYVNRKGVKWDPWQLAYWHNYGTMANRYPGHTFARARDRRSSYKKGGIKPLLFVEKAWDQSQSQVEKAFNETAEKELTRFFQERALK